jgi:hypothetical protein
MRAVFLLKWIVFVNFFVGKFYDQNFFTHRKGSPSTSNHREFYIKDGDPLKSLIRALLNRSRKDLQHKVCFLRVCQECGELGQTGVLEAARLQGGVSRQENGLFMIAPLIPTRQAGITGCTPGQ